MAAAAVPQIGYPIMLSYNGTVVFDDRKLENHLIQQLSYSQTEASTLVNEITSLVRENNKLVLMTVDSSMDRSSASGDSYSTISRSQ